MLLVLSSVITEHDQAGNSGVKDQARYKVCDATEVEPWSRTKFLRPSKQTKFGVPFFWGISFTYLAKDLLDW